MSPARLYIDATLRVGDSIELHDDRARYVSRVMRLGPGDPLVLFDGGGDEFEASIESFGRNSVRVRVARKHTPDVESDLAIRLLQGISRGDRMDLVVQKTTELGIQRITPVLTEYSVVKLDQKRREKRRAHWHNIAISAAEQSGRTRLPQIDPVAGLRETLGELVDAAGCRLLLDPRAQQSISAAGTDSKTLTLLIGPEGGFSDTERELAAACGFRAVRAGPRIMRTETAAIAAVAALQLLYGDLDRAWQPPDT